MAWVSSIPLQGDFHIIHSFKNRFLDLEKMYICTFDLNLRRAPGFEPAQGRKQELDQCLYSEVSQGTTAEPTTASPRIHLAQVTQGLSCLAFNVSSFPDFLPGITYLEGRVLKSLWFRCGKCGFSATRGFPHRPIRRRSRTAMWRHWQPSAFYVLATDLCQGGGWKVNLY